MKEFRLRQAEAPLAGRLDLIQGHVIDYPTRFLGDEVESEMHASQLAGVEVFV
jgi:hypothetical protein